MFGFNSLRSMSDKERVEFEEMFCYTKNETLDGVLIGGSSKLCFLDDDLYLWYEQQIKNVYETATLEEVFFISGSGFWCKCVETLI